MDSIVTALENVAANKGRLCESLHYIRSNFSNNSEGINELRNLGGIRTLMECLKQVNPKVLSLTLSILGNCSMDKGCRSQLLSCGVTKDLVFILKNINVDSIHNRSCRMIANLAVCENYTPLMIFHNIPSVVVHVLSNTKCNATRYSAIRALRKIWEYSPKPFCSEMVKCQAIRAVSELITSKCKDIVIAVLRAQISFLSNASNPKYASNNALVVTQILGCDNESENSVKTYMNLLPEHPIISKIIYIMSKIPSARIHLGQSRLIFYVLNYLKQENNHYLSLAMCHLLECPMNRSKFAETKEGTKIFMDLISGTDPTQKELAINTLIHFQYCSNPLIKMVKDGLILMLMKNLSTYIQANKIPHPCPSEVKPKSLDTSSTYLVSCASPAGSSGMSPNLSARTSYTPPLDESIATDSYSPYYSPVCESFDNESINTDESESNVSDFEVKDDKLIVEKPEKSMGDDNVILFLTHLSYMEPLTKHMAIKEVWETILDYIQYLEYRCPNPIKILQNITQNVLNLKTIVSNGFILTTHQRLCRPIHKLKMCKYCESRNDEGMQIIKNTAVTFESQFAEAMIVSIMRKPDSLAANKSFKILASVTIPLVVLSKPKNLIILLSRYKVYNYLRDIIQDDQNEMFNDAVGALMALFKTSNITYKKLKHKHCQDQNCFKNIIKKETTVTLALDDGTLINTNKSFLSLKSPMFEAMFRCGGFKEAYQNTIRLNDVSLECFKSLLDILELYCDCLLPKNINILLELIMITDKYMLTELSEKIYTVMINSISIDNCRIIYEWTKETNYQLQTTSNLSFDVVKYLFSSNSRFPNRVEAIKKISKSNYGPVFMKDLLSVLKLGLSSICHGDKIAQYYLGEFSE